MKQQFIPKNFGADAIRRIIQANQIIEQYRQQGYTLSLRQLYYQHVARDLIPNSERSYKNLGTLISDARYAGLIDWEAIEDRGRQVIKNNHWTSPAQIVRASANQFRIERWKDQPCHVEVMVEKDALSGVLIPVCRRLDILFTANKGYSSSSAMYEASLRMKEAADEGKEVHVLYLGDHDPSGIDMSRDVSDRLKLFLGVEYYEQEGRANVRYEDEDSDVELVTTRLALNWDQVQEYNPPENPAKLTDSRAKVYVERFGDSSWELDALEPTVLAGLVSDAVTRLIDYDRWNEAIETENEMKARLKKFADEYESEMGESA